MGSAEYLEFQMQRFSAILGNASQRDDINKDEILDKIKMLLDDYKMATGSSIFIRDYRKE